MEYFHWDRLSVYADTVIDYVFDVCVYDHVCPSLGFIAMQTI